MVLRSVRRQRHALGAILICFQTRFCFCFSGNSSDNFQLARQRTLKGPGGVGDRTHATTRIEPGSSELEAQSKKIETFGFLPLGAQLRTLYTNQYNSYVVYVVIPHMLSQEGYKRRTSNQGYFLGGSSRTVGDVGYHTPWTDFKTRLSTTYTCLQSNGGSCEGSKKGLRDYRDEARSNLPRGTRFRTETWPTTLG